MFSLTSVNLMSLTCPYHWFPPASWFRSYRWSSSAPRLRLTLSRLADSRLCKTPSSVHDSMRARASLEESFLQSLLQLVICPTLFRNSRSLSFMSSASNFAPNSRLLSFMSASMAEFVSCGIPLHVRQVFTPTCKLYSCYAGATSSC